MFGFKFDEDKIKVAIDIYKEEHGSYPYLILNTETEKYLPTEIAMPTYSSLFITCGGSFSDCTDHSDNTKEINKSKRTKWHNAKILIDNDLKLGEVLIK